MYWNPSDDFKKSLVLSLCDGSLFQRLILLYMHKKRVPNFY